MACRAGNAVGFDRRPAGGVVEFDSHQEGKRVVSADRQARASQGAVARAPRSDQAADPKVEAGAPEGVKRRG